MVKRRRSDTPAFFFKGVMLNFIILQFSSNMLHLLRRTVMLVLLIAAISEVQAQRFWTAAGQPFEGRENERTIAPAHYTAITIDSLALLSLLKTAPMEFSKAAATSPLILELPLTEGKMARFAVVESPVLEASYQAQYPNIRTYGGQGIDDKTATIKIDWTDYGWHVQVLSAKDEPLFIDPYMKGDKERYMVYHKSDLPGRSMPSDVVLKTITPSIASRGQSGGLCYGSQLRTYRLALACTGEYAVAVAGSSPTAAAVLSYMVTTIARVNGVYEKELATRLTMIDNSSIIFLNGTTDPYTNSSVGSMLGENQTAIDTRIGTGNYDIGHVFSTSSEGGVAYLGSICTSSKAGGVTGSALPTGDAYDIDYVAHEMGHQLGGEHTFNANTVACGGSNRSTSGAAVEPGSGITIMAYAGICGATNNLGQHSIPYFHAYSQNEILGNLLFNWGSTCGTSTNTGNAVPVANAGGVNYTIPASTPFILTGSGSDVNNSEVLTYSWEEMDPGAGAGNWNSGSKPYFRSFVPTTKPVRYLPQLSDVLNGTTTVGEILPTGTQTLNFRLTVRDNRSGGGGVCSDDMSVSTTGTAGPFTVSSQNTATNWTANGTNQATVTWNVANSNIAPVNCSNVSILFSSDGGYTWPYTLVSSTPNNGSATFTIPNISTTNGRIMVKAVGNIFFAVNTGTVSITSVCGASGATVTPAAAVSAQAGNSQLNLNLSPSYGSFVPAGTVTQSDAYGLDPNTFTGGLAISNTSTSGCANSAANQYQYQSYTFKVTVSGTYTFTLANNNGFVVNLYSNSFTSTSPCTNFIASSATWPGSGSVTLNAAVSASLTAGNTYVLTIGTFSNTLPALPASYRITISTASGGVAYQPNQLFTNPGAGYNYGYVVVNNATNNIVYIGASSDLSNSSTFPAGQYTVYGLSYATSISNLSSYVGGSFSALVNQLMNNPTTFCADLSKNSVTVNVTGTFPVQFTALQARKQGEKALLEWGTLSEQNTDKFIVQRSARGDNFSTELGSVKAAGSSNTEKHYSFVDAAPIQGWNYYRIKQMDVDGRYTFSNVAALNYNKAGSVLLVYPNPAKDNLTLEYTSARSGKVTVQLIDTKGAVLLSKVFAVVAGKNQQNINVSNLSQGMYLLKYVDSDGTVSFSKFIRQ